MSRCARCGRNPDSDGKTCESDASAMLHCRDRQIANQASLLRSVTIKLEKAHQLCTDDYPKSAAGLIEQVLETLA